MCVFVVYTGYLRIRFDPLVLVRKEDPMEADSLARVPVKTWPALIRLVWFVNESIMYAESVGTSVFLLLLLIFRAYGLT